MFSGIAPCLHRRPGLCLCLPLLPLPSHTTCRYKENRIHHSKPDGIESALGAFDVVKPNELEGKVLTGIDCREDPYEAAAGCDAIAVMTEWDIYATLDFEKIYGNMQKPAFIFDGRNILDHINLFKIGFNVFPIGKPPLTHF